MLVFQTSDKIFKIGITDFRNIQQPFGIKSKDRLQHIYAIGKTGVGKSTLLENMAIADIENGEGVAVIDPHGDLAESLLDYIPQSRINDVIYFNATDFEFPISFNPLYDIANNKIEVVASILISTFKKIWSDSWGPRLEYIFRNCVLTLLESKKDATLLDIQPLLVHREFRLEVLRHISNTQLLSFWYNEYEKYPVPLRAEAISPILNKVGVFNTNNVLRSIFGQRVSTINLHDMLQQQKILICNFSKGVIGEDISRLLGSVLMSMIHFAALQRAEILAEQRKPFYVYVDEMHSFINLSFVNTLSEARKFGLGLFLTHQYLEQLPEDIRSAIFGNVGTIVSFRTGAEDGAYLAKEFYPTFDQSDFINLPPYSIYIKLMIDGVSSKPFSAKTLPLKHSQQLQGQDVVQYSRTHYGNKYVENKTETDEFLKSSNKQQQLF